MARKTSSTSLLSWYNAGAFVQFQTAAPKGNSAPPVLTNTDRES
jgi:hypothetical protein